jgi:N-methylhydantoinase B
VSLRLTRGDLVLIETCGGGGFGAPAERSPAAREHDRREGYV